MIKKFSYILVLVFFAVSQNLSGQDFAIDGITGISFSESDQDYTAQITDDFTAYGLEIAPENLSLSYSNSENSFSISGAVNVSIEGDLVSSNIDFNIINKIVDHILFDVSSDFTLKGLQIEPINLGFEWDTFNDYFKMYGTLNSTLETNAINLSLGSSDAPGLTISNGVLNSIETTVTADFSFADITFTPKDLTYLYNESSDLFEMYGGADTSFDGESISVSLGASDSPGLEYKDNVVDKINMGVSSDFTIKNLEIEPTDLTFEYDKSATSYKIYGSLKSSLEGNEIELQLGDTNNPGLVIENGDIKKVETTVTADFSFSGITFTPTDLTFLYNESSDLFEMYGGADTSFDGETISVSLGASDSPGLEYKDNVIDKINMGVSSDFTIKDLEIEPTDLTFEYDKSDSRYKMHGSLKSKLEGNEIELKLGNSNEPGLVIKNGDVKKVETSVTAEFSFADITFTPTDLTFLYNESSDLFEMYGGADTSFDGESIKVSLGTSDSPGLEYKDSVVDKINMGVSSDFTIKDLEIEPKDLTFEYDKSATSYKMHGSLKSRVEGNELELKLGNSTTPGLVIDKGVVKKIKTEVTANFKFSEMTFEPKELTFLYNASNDLFEMYGELHVTFDGERLFAKLGNETTPGFEYKNKKVQKIDVGVTSDFKLKELEIKPTDLTFIYSRSGEKYEMYGDITFKVGDDEIEAILGDASDPGMILKNNKIKQVNIGVSSTFKISGLKIKATDVGVDWKDGSFYHFYGDADLSIANDDIDADFGTFSDPGVKIEKGKLHSLEVDINSDLKLGNLEVETKDLDVQYTNNKFEVKGKLLVKEGFSLSVTLGNGNQGGLEIDVSGNEPKFKLEDFTIDIEHANLGAIDIKQIKLEFNNVGIVESDVKVVFPEGWEIDATMKFKDIRGKAELNEIKLDYRANNISDAIEIFEGVQLTYLEGDVKNLTRPSTLEVSGTIGTIYGGGFTLDNKSATFLEMTDGVTISSREFKINGDVNVGAYRSGTNSWRSILGSGDIDFTAYFHHYVKAKVNAKYPGDPLIEADLTAYFDSHGSFDGLLDVEFIVPHWVPFIGGKHYGSVDGAVRYKKGDLNGSFGAGWVRIKTFWHTYHVGAKYNFGSRHVSKIGSGSISSIESTIKHDEERGKSKNSSSNESKVFEFDITDTAPNAMLIDIDWKGEVDKALINVVGPEGTYELTKAVIVNENAIDQTPTLSYEENMTLVEKDTVTTFIFKTPSAFSEEEVVHSNLLNGRYHLVVSFPDTTTEIDSIQFNPIWQDPESIVNVTKTSDNKFDLSIDYWSAKPDSTLISFYVNNINSYKEGRLIQHVNAVNYNELGYGSENIIYTPKPFEGGTSELYFYAVIEDGVGPPLKSEISSLYSHNSDVYGTINLATNSIITSDGLRIFLDLNDNGSYDTNSTGGIEPSIISNENDSYVFRNLSIGTYNLRIVLPEGFRIVGGEDNFSSIPINFNGTPLNVDINIETY